jgi:diguanylate cyclase (GGDEF)-like protein
MDALFFFIGIVAVLMIWYGVNKLWFKLQGKINDLTTILNLVENSKDIIYYCELKPTIKYRYLSPAIETVLSPNLVKESMENPFTAFDRIHPDDYPLLVKKVTGELDYNKPIIQRWRNDDGNYIWFEEYTTPVYQNGQIVAIQGIIRNITDKIELQQKLEYKASHDTLTDLYNRGHFESKMEQYDRISDVSIAIVIFDLDELKVINDHYGHKMGDNLIKETAGIIKRFSGDDVIAARIGGDEFAVLLVNTDFAQADAFMDNIQNELHQLNEDEERLFRIKISKGCAFSSTSIGKMDELFIEADNRMYREKNKKREYWDGARVLGADKC